MRGSTEERALRGSIVSLKYSGGALKAAWIQAPVLLYSKPWSIFSPEMGCIFDQRNVKTWICHNLAQIRFFKFINASFCIVSSSNAKTFNCSVKQMRNYFL